jgi:hypothetical protein
VSYRRSLAAFVALTQGRAGQLASLDDGVLSLEAVLAAESASAETELAPALGHSGNSP